MGLTTSAINATTSGQKPGNTSVESDFEIRMNGFKKSTSVTTQNLIGITSPNGLSTAVISPDFGANVLSFRVSNEADQLGTEIAHTFLDINNLPTNPSKLRMGEIGGLTPFMCPPGRTTMYAGKSTLEHPFNAMKGLFRTKVGGLDRTPIHGGLFNRKWEVESSGKNEVKFILNTTKPENSDLRAVYGDITIQRDYYLIDGGKLKIQTTVTNNNRGASELAWGSHSYFNTPDRDSWFLDAKAVNRWETDSTTNEPTGNLLLNTQFNGKTSLRNQKSDTVFTGLAFGTDRFSDSYLSRKGGPTIVISASSKHQHRCVFLPYDTPENGGIAKPFMCVESQTSSADSFANHMPKDKATPIRIPGSHRECDETNFAVTTEIIEALPN